MNNQAKKVREDEVKEETSKEDQEKDTVPHLR